MRSCYYDVNTLIIIIMIIIILIIILILAIQYGRDISPNEVDAGNCVKSLFCNSRLAGGYRIGGAGPVSAGQCVYCLGL